MSNDAVFLAGNLVRGIFEHFRIFEKIANSIISVVGPELAVHYVSADSMAVIVLRLVSQLYSNKDSYISDTFNATIWCSSNNVKIRPHAIGELSILKI